MGEVRLQSGCPDSGYVFTSIDSIGTAKWLPSSGGGGGPTLYTADGAVNNRTVDVNGSIKFELAEFLDGAELILDTAKSVVLFGPAGFAGLLAKLGSRQIINAITDLTGQPEILVMSFDTTDFSAAGVTVNVALQTASLYNNTPGQREHRVLASDGSLDMLSSDSGDSSRVIIAPNSIKFDVIKSDTTPGNTGPFLYLGKPSESTGGAFLSFDSIPAVENQFGFGQVSLDTMWTGGFFIEIQIDTNTNMGLLVYGRQGEILGKNSEVASEGALSFYFVTNDSLDGTKPTGENSRAQLSFSTRISEGSDTVSTNNSFSLQPDRTSMGLTSFVFTDSLVDTEVAVIELVNVVDTITHTTEIKLNIDISGSKKSGDVLTINSGGTYAEWLPQSDGGTWPPTQYADDAAAGAAGLFTGRWYQTSGAGAAPLNVAGILMVKQ